MQKPAQEHICSGCSLLLNSIIYAGLPVTERLMWQETGSLNAMTVKAMTLLDLYEVKDAPKSMIRTTSDVCLVCELEAKTAAQLHEHMHCFHVGLDPYQCDCGSAFLTAQYLWIHKCALGVQICL